MASLSGEIQKMGGLLHAIYDMIPHAFTHKKAKTSFGKGAENFR